MRSLLLAMAVAAAPVHSEAADARPAPTPAPAGETSDAAKLEADIARELGAQPAPRATATPMPPGAATAGPATPGGAPDQAPPAQPTGGNPFARLLALPDISAIGRAGLSYLSPDTGRLSARDSPFAAPGRVRAVFDEVELGLQAIVDPYARADVFLGFSQTGVEVEEAYVTWLRLPYGFVARGGELFAPFGRVNTQHPHTFEFVDYPLVLQRLLAPAPLGGPGLEASWLAPLPWYAELKLAYQSVPPAVEPETAARQPGAFARFVNFFDVGERTTVGAGASGGLSEEASGWRDLAGADVYVKYRPGATGAYLSGQGEAIVRRVRGTATAEDGTAWGAYAQAVYRPDRRTGYGLRFERAPAATPGIELRTSGLFFFDPSEFQRIRVQAGWNRLPGGHDGFEAVALFEFSIGAHGAHPF